MSLNRLWLAGVTTLISTLALPAHGDDLQGTSKLLERLQALDSAAPKPATTPDTSAALAQDLTSFSQSASTLSPTEAARQWLALYDRSQALPATNNAWGRFRDSSNQPLLTALPGPANWPELQKEIESRPGGTGAGTGATYQAAFPLRMLVHTLNNNETQQWADLATLDPSSLSREIGANLSAVSNQPDAVEKYWTNTFQDLAKNSTGFGSEDGVGVELPDFVTLLGANRAEPLLLQALTVSPLPPINVQGKATQQLARKLALANLDKLKAPPWYLTESLDASDLYDALLKKFPASLGTDPNVTLYHILSLVIQGKVPEAVTATSSLNIDPYTLSNALQKAVDAGYGGQIYPFLKALLQAHPEGNWNDYIGLAARTGHAPEALKFVQDTMARTDLTPAARANVGASLYSALLAVDKVDEGVAELRKLIATAKATQATVASPPSAPANGVVSMIQHISGALSYAAVNQTQDKLPEWDLQLARIGHLLKRDDWEKEGLDDARLRLPNDRLVAFLIEIGRNAEAEQLLMDAIVKVRQDELAQTAAPGQPLPVGSYRSYGAYSASQGHLVLLATVYNNTGRWTDLLTLLQKVPGWGAGDLVTIAGKGAYLDQHPNPCLGLMAARALAETGQLDQARRVLDDVLQIKGGSDAAYELLLKIGQGDLIAKLDALYQQDQFENRPLIWKATLLLQQGKVDEAEQVCKAAIAVDPSDGETGKGDRMRVYSVMADICDAKKDAKQAAFFRNVVKAIRLSEDADDYAQAGLITHAVTLYAQALDLFSDAYCIQSRLARRLAELGRMDEAAIHYRKAFELMPVSFGRMESHCFGCERAFDGKTAADIARQTFTDMLKKDPTKPQLWYLLGYLEKEQGNDADAVTHFQKAAELDPDYINAWKQILEAGTDYQLKPDLRDRAVFNVLRLDPQGRHTSPDMTKVRDLARLWTTLEACVKAVPPPPQTLLVLEASAEQQKAKEARAKAASSTSGIEDDQRRIQEQIMARINAYQNHRYSPNQAVIRNAILTSVFQYFPE